MPESASWGEDVCSLGGWGLLWGVCSQGDVCSRGGLLWGVSGPRGLGLLPGGVSSGGCLVPGDGYPSMHWGRPPLLTESQTPVKTLPWPNFVAAGNEGFAHARHGTLPDDHTMNVKHFIHFDEIDFPKIIGSFFFSTLQEEHSFLTGYLPQR